MTLSPRFLTLPVTAVALLAFAPAADAMIQVDRGIAGARIGNTRAQVRAALGTPSKTTSGTNEFGAYMQYRFTGGVTVTFQGKTRVTAVETTGRGDRTAGGVGVGSSEAAVARVRGVSCETIAGARSCHTGAFEAGKRVTNFQISGGKVTRVTVGIVID